MIWRNEAGSPERQGMPPFFSVTIVQRLTAALFIVASVFATHAAHAANSRAATPDDQARIEQGQKDLLDEVARFEQRRKREIAAFAAEHPAAPGSDRDFPYHLALYPMIDPVVGAHARPSLCIGPDGASAQLWCNEVGGPSIVRGDQIKIVVDNTTLIGCNALLTQADADLRDRIEGVSTWHRDKDIFYLGQMRFRIDADPRSCGSARTR
jgi:hypothetical protein